MSLFRAIFILALEVASAVCMYRILVDSTDNIGSLTPFQWFVVFSLLVIKARQRPMEDAE